MKVRGCTEHPRHGYRSMSKATREHLSSLMDGELTADAARFLTRRMGSDEELNGAWQRYHLVRDCLRRPGEARTLTRLRVDLEAKPTTGPALDEAPHPSRDRGGDGIDGRGRRRWLKPVTGSAIAASVAAVAVLVAVNVGPGQPGPAAEPFTSPEAAGLSPRLVSQPASFDAMERYLLRHNQAAGAVGQKGFVSLVPIVAPAPVQRIEDEAPEPGEPVAGDDAPRERP